jgi:peroxiredoxin
MSDTLTGNRVLQRILSIIVVLGSVVAAYLGGYYFAASSKSSSSSIGTINVKEKLAKSAQFNSSVTNAWDIPGFSLPDLDDQLHSLADWKGKVIMLNFWATWCPPCQYEIPEFMRYQKDYGSKGLQIIGIGIDEKRKLSNFVRTFGINYPVLVASEAASGKVLSEWGNRQQILPYTVIIDRDGHIIYIQRGQFGDEEFQEFVLPLLS